MYFMHIPNPSNFCYKIHLKSNFIQRDFDITIEHIFKVNKMHMDSLHVSVQRVLCGYLFLTVAQNLTYVVNG